MTEHARIVIIGGGAMGVSALYHLAKLGWNESILLEKNELTAGSTWHAAGLCTHFAHNLTIQAMRAESVQLYAHALERDTGSPVSFHATGALRITRSRERMDEFRHVQGIGKFSRYPFNILTPTELKSVYPLVDPSGIVGAIHEPLDGHVDPSQATHAMATGARARGATIKRQTEVLGIASTPSGKWRITTTADDVVTEHVVIAAGTWAHQVGRMLGLDLPIVPILHQYLVTESVDALSGLNAELPMIRDPEQSWYVRQERDGFIIGPYERDGVTWAIDRVPDTFGMQLLEPDLDRIAPIVAAAQRRIPALTDAGIKTIVNGPITFTPDALPLIGPAFGVDKVWLLTGSSMGVMEGGGAGKLLAEWIVQGVPPMDATAIDPRRFGEFADRHFRIAKAKESYAHQFAIHYPFEERPAGRDKTHSPVHDAMIEAGAQFGQVYGWERPNWFARATDTDSSRLTFARGDWFQAVGGEVDGVTRSAGIADMSALSKFNVVGADAERFMQTLGANRPPTQIGGIRLIHALTAHGGVASEFTVVKRTASRYYVTSAAAARRHDHDLLRNRAREFDDVIIEDVTQAFGVIAIAGPESIALLDAVSDNTDDVTMPWLHARTLRIAGHDVLTLRLSYVGECGFELHAPAAHLTAIHDRLLATRSMIDFVYFGAYAINTMRLEKAYPAWGVDLTTERSPIESNLSKFVQRADRSFIGDSALDTPARYRLQALQLESTRYDPFGMHPVLHGDEPVGLVTSGGYGYRVGKGLALAYLDVDSPTDSLTVEICGVPHTAIVLPRPAFDPDNERLRK